MPSGDSLTLTKPIPNYSGGAFVVLSCVAVELVVLSSVVLGVKFVTVFLAQGIPHQERVVAVL